MPEAPYTVLTSPGNVIHLQTETINNTQEYKQTNNISNENQCSAHTFINSKAKYSTGQFVS